MTKTGIRKSGSILLAGCLSLVLVIAGCGSGSNASTSPPKETAATGAGADNSPAVTANSDEKVTIHLLTRTAGGDPMVGPLTEAKEAFMKLHPNVTFQDDSVNTEDAYNNKLKTAIATGATPDIFYFNSVAGLAQWAKNGVIMDISPMMEDKAWSDGFIPGAFDVWNLEKYGTKGHYAIPIGFNPEVVYYNPDLFAKAGITKLPETMDDFYDVIDKLNAAKIIPIGTGAKDTWRTGHIHNNLIYRTIGVEKVKDLGTRKAKWTDPDVVQSLALLKDLKTRNAFQKGFEGIDFNAEQSDFFAGKSAMSINGAWMIGDIVASKSPYKDKISFFPFPYQKDKPQFKSDSVLFTEGYMLSGTMKGAEKAMTIEFAKFFTNKDQQQNKLTKIQRLGARTDITPAADAPKIFKDMVSYMQTIKVPGGDYFDYDPDAALIDISRNAIIGMLLKYSPEEAAKQIQDEIDKYVLKNK